jgi:hypothetical protein
MAPSTTVGTAMSNARPAKNATMTTVNVTLTNPVPIAIRLPAFLVLKKDWPVNPRLAT